MLHQSKAKSPSERPRQFCIKNGRLPGRRQVRIAINPVFLWSISGLFAAPFPYLVLIWSAGMSNFWKHHQWQVADYVWLAGVMWPPRSFFSVGYEKPALSGTIALRFEGVFPVNEALTCLPNKQPALRVMPMPADLNQNGDVFGGWVMAQVDVAGAIPAMRRARGRVATVSVNSFQFRQPVSVGDIVSLYAEIIRVGRTSMTVRVEVFAERNYADPVVVRVTEAELTYVAIDANGGKRPIPDEN